MAEVQRKTIRIEDLGGPVQKLLRAMQNDLSEDDMALLEWISVKDMAKLYGEMGSEGRAEEIWEELRSALQARKRKAEQKRRELEGEIDELDEEVRRQQEEEERQARLDEEARADAEREAEERRRRKEERKRRKAEEAEQREQEEAELQAQQQEEEAQRAAEEEEHKREEKRRKREEKARKLQEEQDRLREAAAAEKHAEKQRRKNQKSDWDKYVAEHPLEFTNSTEQEIQQVKVDREEHKAPPKASEDLLNRMYTPKCPNCHAKFSKPPQEWDCPMCLRRMRQRIKTWQPDDDTSGCMICKASVGRFSRHHCRNCGRIVCTKCSTNKANIASIGYKDSAVKVCDQCAGVSTKPAEVTKTEA